MKRAMILGAIVVALFATSVFAHRIACVAEATDEPPVSLGSALEIAKTDLKDESYYCVGASLAKTFSRADWELHYCTKDGKQMWVSVASDKSVKKSEQGFGY